MPFDARTAPAHQRAHGEAAIALAAGEPLARLVSLHQAAPLRWLLPEIEPDEPRCGALVNVGGGLAGGDRLRVSVSLGAGAAFTATTPAAEKIYRSLGPLTEVTAALAIEEGGSCEWLPQETILFEGARLRRRLEADLAPGGRLLAGELLVFGRAAHGERFARGELHDAWRIRRGGGLVWADALRLEDPAAAAADRFLLAGAGAAATLVLAMPGAAAWRALLRDHAAGAASLVAPGVLVARWLGEAGEVRAALGGAIAALRQAAFGHPPRLPRLWRS